MTSARDYNTTQLAAGRLTIEHITRLVQYWQASAHPELTVDGMAGPATIATIDAAMRPAPFLNCPLPVLADGRRAQVTSGFRQPDRPTHNGFDWFYRWMPGDKPDFAGDHGAEGRKADGSPAWVVPTGTFALASADGVVSYSGMTATGFAIWIDHTNGLRSGYFHLRDASVPMGWRVHAGMQIGLVGDNPLDTDGCHLHFELSPVDRYEPMDPTPYLLPERGARAPCMVGAMSKYIATDMVTAQIEKAFTYHAPKDDQVERYEVLRNGAKVLALLIAESTPVSREQSLALTNLEQAVMHANAAIARNE